jgi:hypothetical protein
MKKQATSNELIQAMLDQQLEANEIKVVLAYVSLGGWKEGQEVFLPERIINKYGMNKTTIKRHRKTLIAKGWMTPTGNKSMYGVDMYLITIPAQVKGGPVCTPWETILDQGVDQKGLGGGPFRSTEVIKEVIKEVANEVTKSVPDAHSSVVPPSSSTSSLNKNDREDQDEQAILIGSNIPAPAHSPMGAIEARRVDQNDLPSWATEQMTEDEKIEEYKQWKARQPKKEPKAQVIVGGLVW